MERTDQSCWISKDVILCVLKQLNSCECHGHSVWPVLDRFVQIQNGKTRKYSRSCSELLNPAEPRQTFLSLSWSCMNLVDVITTQYDLFLIALSKIRMKKHGNKLELPRTAQSCWNSTDSIQSSLKLQYFSKCFCHSVWPVLDHSTWI